MAWLAADWDTPLAAAAAREAAKAHHVAVQAEGVEVHGPSLTTLGMLIQ